MPGRLCAKCGADPSLAMLEPAPAAGPPAATAEPQAPTGERRKSRSGKRRKSSHFMLKLVGGWTLVLALIVGGARLLWRDETPARNPTAASADPSTAPTVSNEDIALLNEAGPKCGASISGFLSAGTPEERNQFVLAPIATAARMARFYDLNAFANVDPAVLRLTASAVLNLPDGKKAIETQWNAKDGARLEAVFREESGEWRLDWEHFARYSDYPWPLFLAGSGPAEGEYRLLVRERLADEHKDSKSLSIVLYTPRFGYPGDAGLQSPEFILPRDSRDGKLLAAGFKLARHGERVFGVKLHALDPDGMIRVRVKVRRSEVNLERKFEIVEILACHWYSVNAPGVEVPADAHDR